MKRVAALLLAVSVYCPGQNISCSLSGTVEDSLGAVFPGLDVTITSIQTGFVRTTKTNQEGFFSFPDLTPSTYTIAITAAAGFKRYTQAGIAISSGEPRSLGVIRLQLGEVTESVTVEAETTPVQLGSGERAGVLTGEEISGMALRGRDFMDAIGLLPGVVDTSDGREAPSPTG